MAIHKGYTKLSIQTADPRAVIVLLYEGVIGYLNGALGALDSNDRTGMSEQIARAQRIIHHLSGALDFEQGGEIAQNLSNLYTYMRDTLSEVVIQCNRQKLLEVIDLMRPLLDAWRQIASDPGAMPKAQGPNHLESAGGSSDGQMEAACVDAGASSGERVPFSMPEQQEPSNNRGVGRYGSQVGSMRSMKLEV